MKRSIISIFLLSIIGLSGNYGQTWTQKAAFSGTSRGTAVGFAIGDYGYIGSGFDYNSGQLASFYKYNSTNDTWSTIPNLLPARSRAVCFTIDSNAYVVTGVNGNTSLADCWEYSATNNTWTQKANIPGVGRFSACGFSIGNKGYVGLGITSTYNVLSDFYEYDPSNNTWTQKANCPVPRAFIFSFSINNKGYIGCGTYPSGTPHNEVYEYDPDNDTWTQKANFPGPARSYSVAISNGNYAIIGTGLPVNTNTGLSDFWKYDPINDTWTSFPSFTNAPRSCAVGFSIGNMFYIGTGSINGALLMKDLWSTDITTEIPGNTLLSNYLIYPNPSSDYIFITTTSEIKNGTILLYSIHGELLLKQSAQEEETMIDISTLSKGVYILKLVGQDINVINKIIKE
ncbi:MAG TPA: kelch repeat-containing protein [Bacteroidales bacterium]|nr:kelch repeat-containing protein [Bacteroidales bacterium]